MRTLYIVLPACSYHQVHYSMIYELCLDMLMTASIYLAIDVFYFSIFTNLHLSLAPTMTHVCTNNGIS